MRNRVLIILAIAIIAPCSSSPDEVEDFNSIASSLSHKNSDIKITDEKRVKTIEIKSQKSDQSSFLSHYLHQGHNLFFKPQILLGTSINNPLISQKPEDNEVPEKPVLPDIDIKKNDTSKEEKPETQPDIPEAPLLPPLEMPVLPETVVVQDEVHNVPCEEVIIEKQPLVIPVPPAFIPLNPPKIPIEVILPNPLPHVPICLIDNCEITVPCPPPIALSPEIINIKNVVENTVILPQPSPIIPVRLPKIPLGVIYNKPVKTVVPYLEGFVSTTRFLPSVKVSKISLEKFRRDKVQQIPSGPLPDIVVQKFNREKVRIIEEAVPTSSFSAYCAHNIALERVLPNIVEGREIINVAPLPPILEIPVRPIY